MEAAKLRHWMEANSARLRSKGYALTFKDHEQGQASLDLDSTEFMGTISCWPNGPCEVQFNSTRSGDVLFLLPEIELEGDHLIKALEQHRVI